MVIWLTGLSGSGKTTLGRALRELISPAAPVVFLDGDAVRAAIGDDLGFREEDRVVQIGRLARLARLLADQGIVVVVAALYAGDSLLAWNRANLPGYLEVYVSASMETPVAGLPNVVGVDIPWHAPAAPDLVIDMDHPEPAPQLARRVVALVPSLASHLTSTMPGEVM